MISIKTLASGSTGNAYVIDDGKTPLLLEAGIRIQKIKQGCGYGLSGMAGCLISHEHHDHSKAAADVMACGVDVFCSAGTAEAAGLRGHRLHIVKSKEQFSIGTWRIMPFKTEHDAREPLGFLLSNGTDKLLFATDTFYLHYTFRGLTYVMLECNYALDTLDENIAAGYVDESRRSRLLKSHMSLEQCKATLAANDLSNVRQIYLMHLSFKNSDAARFKREIQRLTGKEVYICQNRLEA
ncbi:MAG: MBL fold metallo-hydrolase [Oscillospiraceae bacterium]|nr:MBL fold metallo-hydrolase [Oscillospiraceae bacterium]